MINSIWWRVRRKEGGGGSTVKFCCRGADYLYWSLSEGLGKSRNPSRRIQDCRRLKIVTQSPRCMLSSRPVAEPKGNIPRCDIRLQI